MSKNQVYRTRKLKKGVLRLNVPIYYLMLNYLICSLQYITLIPNKVQVLL